MSAESQSKNDSSSIAMSPPDTNANGGVIYSNREQLQEDETKQPIKSSQIKEEEE